MREYANLLLCVGGVYHLLLGVFHILFWKLKIFNWKEELPQMSGINSAVMQLLNAAVIVFLLLMAYISLFHQQELLNTGLGHTLLVGISLFWLVRLGGEFLIKGAGNINRPLTIMFVFGIALYLAPTLLTMP